MEYRMFTHRFLGLCNLIFYIYSNKEFDKSKDVFVTNYVPEKHNVYVTLSKLGINILFDNSLAQIERTPNINNSHNYYDFRQNFEYFDINKFREQLCIDNVNTVVPIKELVYESVPDIQERVCINIRRGDYFSVLHYGKFNVLSKKWITEVYNKYYQGNKVIVVSDDIEWCKSHLSDLCDDIIFYHNENEYIIDLYMLAESKAIIGSGSSFSVIGAYLNKNNDCVFPYPFFRDPAYFWGETVVPNWTKRENI